MPRLPPVTRAVLPSRIFMRSFVFESRPRGGSNRPLWHPRPELREQLASGADLKVVGFFEPGVALRQVEPLERQSRAHRRLAVYRSVTPKRALRSIPALKLRGNLERLSRRHEVHEF